MDFERTFDTEIEKLKALNTVTLEIWDRIKDNYHLSDILKSILFYRNTLRFCYQKTVVKISLSTFF